MEINKMVQKHQPTKTKEEDYYSFVDKRSELECRFQSGDISGDSFDSKYDKLKKEYGGRVHPEDTYSFDTLSEYKDFLDKICEPEVVRDILLHENAHVRKAEELGYTIQYKCTTYIPTNPIFASEIGVRPGIVVQNLRSKEHLEEIVKAPEKLSDGDNKTIRLLKD